MFCKASLGNIMLLGQALCLWWLTQHQDHRADFLSQLSFIHWCYRERCYQDPSLVLALLCFGHWC